MKKWIFVVIYLVLFAVLVGLIAYQILVEKSFDSSSFLKAGLSMVALVLSMIKLFTRQSQNAVNKRSAYKKAYAEFVEGAFQDDPKAEKKFFKAVDFFNSNKYAAALKILHALRPNCVRTADRYAVTVFQGLCYDDLNLYPDAVQLYQAALMIRPNSSLASNLGLCHEKLGDHESAVKAYQQAAHLDPNNAYPHNNLAQMYIRIGAYETALEYAQAAYVRNQTLVPALNALAICHYMLGDQEEYTRWYRQAVSCGGDGAKLKNYIASLDASM